MPVTHLFDFPGWNLPVGSAFGDIRDIG